MEILANYNANGDLIICFTDRTENWNDLCVGVDKSKLDTDDWRDEVGVKFAIHTGKHLSLGALNKAVDKAETIGDPTEEAPSA